MTKRTRFFEAEGSSPPQKNERLIHSPENGEVVGVGPALGIFGDEPVQPNLGVSPIIFQGSQLLILGCACRFVFVYICDLRFDQMVTVFGVIA